MHLRVSRNAFGSTFPIPFLASICIMLLSLASWAQEKPTPKPAAPRKSVLRHPTPSVNTGAGKDPVEEHYRAAETFQLAGDLKAAEAEYRRVISLALQRLAAVRVLSQNERQALVFLQSAIEADPSDVEAQMSLSSVYFRSGDLASAKTILKSVLAKDEHLVSAQNLLGNILFMEGDYAAAADQLRVAVQENSDINAAYSLGRGHEIGSLEPGKQADFVIHDCMDYREIPYFVGVEPAAETYLGGRLVYSRSAA